MARKAREFSVGPKIFRVFDYKSINSACFSRDHSEYACAAVQGGLNLAQGPLLEFYFPKEISGGQGKTETRYYRGFRCQYYGRGENNPYCKKPNCPLRLENVVLGEKISPEEYDSKVKEIKMLEEKEKK
jgi:hypothetical protein